MKRQVLVTGVVLLNVITLAWLIDSLVWSAPIALTEKEKAATRGGQVDGCTQDEQPPCPTGIPGPCADMNCGEDDDGDWYCNQQYQEITHQGNTYSNCWSGNGFGLSDCTYSNYYCYDQTNCAQAGNNQCLGIVSEGFTYILLSECWADHPSGPARELRLGSPLWRRPS